MKPTPTTSPLIEGIIEKLAMAITHSKQGVYAINEEFVREALIHFQNQVESETIERCLKLFPELVIPKKLGRPRKVYEHSMKISKVLLWSQQDIVSAIKKEFKRE